MSTAHTATPYRLTGDGLHIVGGNPQFLVADFDVNRDEDGNRARAKAAMLACNTRDDLVKALEATKEYILSRRIGNEPVAIAQAAIAAIDAALAAAGAA